jgi:hypothetical protein
MFRNWSDRQVAEEAWAEYWQEMALDDEAIRLWEEAQERERQTDYFQQAFDAMRDNDRELEALF